MGKQIKILLIEDDEKFCKEFENAVKNRGDAILCQKTNSSKEA